MSESAPAGGASIPSSSPGGFGGPLVSFAPEREMPTGPQGHAGSVQALIGAGFDKIHTDPNPVHESSLPSNVSTPASFSESLKQVTQVDPQDTKQAKLDQAAKAQQTPQSGINNMGSLLNQGPNPAHANIRSDLMSQLGSDQDIIDITKLNLF